MFWQTILVEAPNGNVFFGFISETSAILIFGICLILSTIGLRWFWKKNDETTKDLGNTKEVVKR
jgi:hypothetical protein